MLDTSQDVENTVIQNEREHIIYSILDECTETQKCRFIKYYYLDYGYTEIAHQKNCTEGAVRKSIAIVEQMLINYEHFR